MTIADAEHRPPRDAGTTAPAAGAARRPSWGARPLARNYWMFALPAVVLIAAVIVFPWVFTVFMSVQEWNVRGTFAFTGLDNYRTLLADMRFLQAAGVTLVFTVLAVILPMVLGTAAALVFHESFPLRGLLRGIFILPMMATPVAISLVWTMMFHPQLGVLNYLLTSVGLPPSQWVYATSTVIPTLVMVEVWHWTPLVMLIVLGGLSQLPREPFEAALIDGASRLQQFRYITVPLIMPFLMIALIIRTIDALKTFDTIFVITGGGPGTASETINIFLYQQAFAFIKLGYASTVAVIFFALIVALSVLLLYVRQRTKWNAE